MRKVALVILSLPEDSPKERKDYAASVDPTQCSANSMYCESTEPEEEATTSIISEPETEPVAAGQCAPPKDEDSLPSCSTDAAYIDASSSAGSDSVVAQ